MGRKVDPAVTALRLRATVWALLGYAKPSTVKLRQRVVKLWNKGYTQAEIGRALGISRGVAGRLIAEARAMGIPTVHYTPSETSQRQQASLRATMGTEAYRAYKRTIQAKSVAVRKAKRMNESPRPGTPLD